MMMMMISMIILIYFMYFLGKAEDLEDQFFYGFLNFVSILLYEIALCLSLIEFYLELRRLSWWLIIGVGIELLLFSIEMMLFLLTFYSLQRGCGYCIFRRLFLCYKIYILYSINCIFLNVILKLLTQGYISQRQ